MAPADLTEHDEKLTGWGGSVRAIVLVLAAIVIAAVIVIPLGLARTRHAGGSHDATVPGGKKSVPTLPTTEVRGTPISDFGGNGPNLWAATPSGKLYVSSSGGTSWTRASTPVPLARLQPNGSEVPGPGNEQASYGITVSGATASARRRTADGRGAQLRAHQIRSLLRPWRPESRAELARVGLSKTYFLGAASPNGKGHPTTVPLWFTADADNSWVLRYLQCGIDAMGARI